MILKTTDYRIVKAGNVYYIESLSGSTQLYNPMPNGMGGVITYSTLDEAVTKIKQVTL